MISRETAGPRNGWYNRYLLMRHGHSQANEQGLIISTPARGLTSYGLSGRGEAQLAKVVTHWPWPRPDRVVHSDFLRTTQTAARVADAFGLTMHSDERLRERQFGELEGLGDAHYPSVWAQDAQSDEHTMFQVESLQSVATRMKSVIDALERAHRGETLLIVSHGDPLQILLTALAGKPLTRHREQPALSPASIMPLDR